MIEYNFTEEEQKMYDECTHEINYDDIMRDIRHEVKEIEARILGFRGIIKEESLLKQYDEWFGITIYRDGKI